MNKKTLIANILAYLATELKSCQQAAKNAHLAATDEQSVAETQYDTLAIESAYLAEGQARRIVEFQQAINALENLKYSENNHSVVLGSLVQLHQDQADNHWFFLAPAAAGYREKFTHFHFTVVTPKSPMGQALMGKQCDDDISIRLGNSELTDVIVGIN